LSKTGITYLSKAGYIPKLSFSDHQFSEHCQYGKQVAAPHPTSVPRESSPLDLVNSDVYGPMPHQSLGGASYFVTFIDDATRKVWVYPTWTKDRVFTSFKYGNGTISWRSKLQDCTASSTTEAQYVATSDAAKEALWVGRLARTFRQCNSKWTPTGFSDSQGVVALAKNPVHHNASKHIEDQYHFIRDCATKELLSLEKISTTDNVVDAMTKSLSTDSFRSLCNRMGVELISDKQP
jgi:hypothetical protein